MTLYGRTSIVSSLTLAGLLIAPALPIVAADAKYHVIEGWARLPSAIAWGPVAGVATDASGHVFAFRRAEPPVLEVTAKGAFVRTFGDKAFAKPHGIRFDSKGSLWVTDQGPNHVVSKLDRQNKVVMSLGTKGVGGDGADTFNGPTDVIVAPNGTIFVADGEFNHRVVKFSADGKFLRQWGTKGDGPGQFLVPHALAMDSRGRVFVADRDNNRVQLFDQEGTFLESWTQFGAPSGIFITKDDKLYVLAASGKKGIFVASAGNGEIADFIETPQTGLHLLAVDSAGAIFVAGLGGSGLVKFARD
jgi:DNA-binding beta-propeller fold protein YncE